MLTGALRHREMREHNIRFVLSLIQQYGPISRPELARRSGLTKASITRIIQDLRKVDLVDEYSGRYEETGGRPAVLIRMKAGKQASVGIDLRIDRMTVLLRDLSGQELARHTERSEPDSDPEIVFRRLGKTIKRLLETHPRVLTGIGVAIGGHPSSDHTGIEESQYLGWKHVEVRGLLREQLDAPELPCYVHDVASCAAEANGAVGTVGGVHSLLHVQYGIGIGAAVPTVLHRITNDTINPNVVGHLPFGGEAETCEVCGWRGCVDSVLGFPSVIRRSADLGIRLSASSDFMRRYCEDLARLWISGDSNAREVVARLENDVARLVTLMSMLQACSTVTIGGWPLYMGKEFVSRVERIVQSNRQTSRVEVTISELGDDAPVIGAAMFGAIAGITRAFDWDSARS
ncbi:MAG: ROK family transcriptional regulator [Actinomycetaceae bacterium]|nr:ROK family transcriptional regulator [Actinomycetaceae bacterium]